MINKKVLHELIEQIEMYMNVDILNEDFIEGQLAAIYSIYGYKKYRLYKEAILEYLKDVYDYKPNLY